MSASRSSTPGIAAGLQQGVVLVEQAPELGDLAKIFDSTEYAKWKGFRNSEDSRYVALTAPRVLAKLRPYDVRAGMDEAMAAKIIAKRPYLTKTELVSKGVIDRKSVV